MAQRVVLVTGAGRGIGRATCVRFGQAGCDVAASARTESELRETARLVSGRGVRCETVCADVALREDMDAVIDHAVHAFGRVDVLVNCAGVAPLGNIDELEPEVFETILDVNISGVYHACRAVWGVMSRQNEGCIVNVSSVAAFDPFPGFAAYGASKAWVNAWTRGLAEEGRKLNIRVFALAPGAVNTKMLRDAFPDFPDDQMLDPAEVADMIFTLADPACRHATGQTIVFRK